MSEQQQVEPGQVWEDWDVRFRGTHGRRMRVITVGMTHAVMENIQTEKRTMIALKRLKPTSNGYRFLYSEHP